MAHQMHTIGTMLISRANLDGRDSEGQTSSSDDTEALILASLASDPDNVQVIPCPGSEQAAKVVVSDIFGLYPGIAINLKRRTVASDGRVVWASIPQGYWSSVVREGDEIRAFTTVEERKIHWDPIPAIVTYKSWKGVILLAESYKATKGAVFEKIQHDLPKKITSSDQIQLRLIVGVEPDGEYDTATIHQKGASSEQWRDLIKGLKADYKSKPIRLQVITKAQTPHLGRR